MPNCQLPCSRNVTTEAADACRQLWWIPFWFQRYLQKSPLGLFIFFPPLGYKLRLFGGVLFSTNIPVFIYAGLLWIRPLPLSKHKKNTKSMPCLSSKDFDGKDSRTGTSRLCVPGLKCAPKFTKLTVNLQSHDDGPESLQEQNKW